jgi:hypothetical protein
MIGLLNGDIAPMHCRSPILAAGNPTSPTAANILLNPPTSGGLVTSYEVQLCPAPPAGSACVRKSCATVNCRVTGLLPGATYIVSAVAIVGGIRVPASNTVPLVMPSSDTPTLTSVAATGSTTGAATAVPPPGAVYTQVGLNPAAAVAPLLWQGGLRQLVQLTEAGLVIIHTRRCVIDAGPAVLLPAVHLHCHAPGWWQPHHLFQCHSFCRVYGPVPRHPGECQRHVLAAFLPCCPPAYLPACLPAQHACPACLPACLSARPPGMPACA